MSLSPKSGIGTTATIDAASVAEYADRSVPSQYDMLPPLLEIYFHIFKYISSANTAHVPAMCAATGMGPTFSPDE
jgi:hypothetical protein